MTRLDEATFAAFARALSTRTGVTLDAYKPKCLARRVAVRMRACAVHTYDAYLEVLDGEPAELERLQAALTSNVTRLFRNAAVWASVAAERMMPRKMPASTCAEQVHVTRCPPGLSSRSARRLICL